MAFALADDISLVANVAIRFEPCQLGENLDAAPWGARIARQVHDRRGMVAQSSALRCKWTTRIAPDRRAFEHVDDARTEARPTLCGVMKECGDLFVGLPPCASKRRCEPRCGRAIRGVSAREKFLQCIVRAEFHEPLTACSSSLSGTRSCSVYTLREPSSRTGTG